MIAKIAPVSAIIPTWRCAPTAAEAIASVFAQTLRPIEVIVIDDASDDGTADVLRAQATLYPEGWLTVVALDTNGGPGMARNVGWDLARGDYVAFLDADDLWHPRKTEIQFGWMDEHRDVKLTGGPLGRIEGRAARLMDKTIGRARFNHLKIKRQLLRNNFATSTVMVRRDMTDRFAIGKRRSEDFLLWTRIMLRGGAVRITDALLAGSRKSEFGEGGLSGDMAAMFAGQLESYRMLEQEGLISRSARHAAEGVAWVRYGIRQARVFTRRALASRRRLQRV